MMTATYDPSDNRLRLYSTNRLDHETYACVKAAGFTWAPKQGVFVAPMWTPAREDLLLDLCGEIGDEDRSLVERAEERAERFADYSAARTADAQAAHTAVERITEHIPLGQPILVGHHSEKRARKDAERIEHGIRKAVQLWDTARYWQDRAKGALRHAKYKERPGVRARRIKGLEADLRKQQRTIAESEKDKAAWEKYGHSEKNARDIANYDHSGSYRFTLSAYPREPPASQYEGEMSLWSALDGGVITAIQAQALAISAHERRIASAQRWVTHMTNRLVYERVMLDDAGGIAADQITPEKGGGCRCWASPQGGWSYIRKANRVSVTIEDNWGNGGANFTRTIPFDKLSALMTAAQVQEKRDAGHLVETDNQAGFWLRDAPRPIPEPPNPDLAPPALEAMRQQLTLGINIVVVEGLFPTPPALADRMVALADLRDGDRVLEPGAGTGNLLKAMGDAPDKVAIESNPQLVKHLGRLGLSGLRIHEADFLTCLPTDLKLFDAVLMNPPFNAGTDTAHVLHALGFLKPGGRLVALVSEMCGQRQTKRDQELASLLEAYNTTTTPLPAGTFHDAGTEVRAKLLWLSLPRV